MKALSAMTCGNRATRSSSRAISAWPAPSLSPAAEARSASARAASGQIHSHSVGGTPGEVAPVIAASYAPAGSPAPSRTCARTASNWNARKPEVSANSSSALARWSSASCCRPWSVASCAATSRADTSAATPGSEPSATRSRSAQPFQSPACNTEPPSLTDIQAR